MDVSVVIVNWNTEELLGNCLESIYRNTKIPGFEVIVVDNNSSDNSVKMVRERFPQTIVIENEKNEGYAAANNIGINRARGRYVLVLNSDTIFTDDSLSRICSFADKHEDAAVFGCKIVNKDMTLQQNTYLFPSLLNLALAVSYLYKIFPRSRFFARERMGWWDWTDAREVEVIVGCYMLVRMEAIREVGLMDNDYFMYFEETDWCYRFKKAGWKNLYAPVSEVIHLGGGSTKKNRDKMFLQVNSSRVLYFKKHQGVFSYVIACFLLFLFFALRVPYWLVHALLSRETAGPDLNTAYLYFTGMVKTLRGWRGLSIRTK
jgi:GT2 family glycosyltransferase